MEVKMTIEFNEEDILAMCRIKLAYLRVPCCGHFELRMGPTYTRTVIATFVPAVEPASTPNQPLWCAEPAASGPEQAATQAPAGGTDGSTA